MVFEELRDTHQKKKINRGVTMNRNHEHVKMVPTSPTSVEFTPCRQRRGESPAEPALG